VHHLQDRACARGGDPDRHFEDIFVDRAGAYARPHSVIDRPALDHRMTQALFILQKAGFR